MSFTISWKVALFLLLGIALIIFLALRYSTILPGTAAVSSSSPIPLPISDKLGHATMRQMPPVRQQFQQRQQHLPIRTQSQQRQPPPPQQQQQQRRPAQETDMEQEGHDENEPGEDEEDPFFSPLN